MPNFGWEVCIIVSNSHSFDSSLEHHRRVLLKNACIPRLRHDHRSRKVESNALKFFTGSIHSKALDPLGTRLDRARVFFVATRKNCIKSSEKVRHLIAMNEKKLNPKYLSAASQRPSWNNSTTWSLGLDPKRAVRDWLQTHLNQPQRPGVGTTSLLESIIMFPAGKLIEEQINGGRNCW